MKRKWKDSVEGARRGACLLRGLLLGAAFYASIASAQNQTFSNTTEYRSMLDELHHDPIHPSRMAAGSQLPASGGAVVTRVNESASALSVETTLWRLNISKSPWALALKNKVTGRTWSGEIAWEAGEGATADLRIGNVGKVEANSDSIRMEVQVLGLSKPAVIQISTLSPTAIRLSIRAPQSEMDNRQLKLNFTGAGPFFGTGERFDRVQLDGLKTTLRPEDLLGRPGHHWTYIPVPFLFTPGGLGVYVDTAEASTFDLSHAQQQSFSIQLGNSSTDFYFFVGEPKKILEDYTSLMGRSPLSPPWAFGIWICSYQGPDTVMNEAKKLREYGIPASAIWTYDVMGKGDIMGWPLWWTGYYPDPAKFTHDLPSMGFKVLTYVHPYLRSVLDPYNLPNPSFDEGQHTGLFVLNAQGEPTGPGFEPFRDGNIDFTSPTNVDWWEQKIREILLTDDFDGWMEDFGEWVNDSDRFSAGVDGRKMANLNPLFYHKITYEIARKAKPDVVEFDRSGYAGSQGFTRVVWGGDQFPNWTQDYGLPSVLKAGISAGLSGFAVWGPDIASNGFSKELWTRWVEFGALTPVMRDHRWDKPKNAIDMWHDETTIDTFRRYAKLHISLFPYFYTYANEAAKTGIPIMRDLLLESPKDARTYDCTDEYLLGEQILVAPVIVKGATTRSLYLPQGSWVDYWTGTIFTGGREVTVPAPIERIPIFVRAGSVLPFIRPDTETLATDLAGGTYRTLGGDLTWEVFPSATPLQARFTLYDDTTIETNQTSGQIALHGTSPKDSRNYEIVLPYMRPPNQVLLNGKPLPAIAARSGWRIDPASHKLHVVFSAHTFDLTVVR